MKKLKSVKKSAVCMIAACIGCGASQARAMAVLEEVVVEAQKKVETTFDTPISVTAITGDQFKKMGGFSFVDVTKQIPGLSIQANTTPDIHMRGVSTVTSVNAPTRTNVYQDGVLRQDLRSVLVLQYDLERFEVLRGPQATLYGKPSPAGTINIRTKGPSLSEMDGYVAGSLATHDSRNVQFGVSIPIIDNELALRLSAADDSNQATGVHNVVSGNDATTRLTGGRAVLLWEPSDDFNARLSYSYWNKHEQFWYAADGGGFDVSDLKLATNVDDFNANYGQITVLELTKVLNDNLQVISVSSYEQSKYHNYTDGDGTPDAQSVFYGTISAGPYAQEDLRLVSNDNDFWDWQLGLYYNRATTKTVVHSDLKTVLFAPPAIAVNTTVVPTFNWEENALYTHHTFKWSDELNTIFGLRYENIRFLANQPTTTVIPAFGSTSFKDAIPAAGQRQYFHAYSGTAKVQYYFDPDLVGYLSFDHSFTRGASNLDSLGNLPAEFSLVKPETSNSFEFGLKGNFWDRRGRFALTTFYQMYKNFAQDVANVSVWNPALNQAQTLFAVVINAKEVDVKGIELETGLALTDGWNVNASLSYSQAKYADFKGNLCNPSGGVTLSASRPYTTCDLSGETLPFAPHWAGVLGSEYSRSLMDGIDWYFNASAKGTSWQYDQSTREKLTGYMTADFFLGLREAADTGWDVNLWVKNAADRRVATRVYRSISSPLGDRYTFNSFDRVFTNTPRQVGVTGTYRF